MKLLIIKIIRFIILKAKGKMHLIIGCKYVFYRQKVEPSLGKMNRPKGYEIRERWFVMIALSCDSCPKSVFIIHAILVSLIPICHESA